MKKVKIISKQDPKDLQISCDGQNFDISRIKELTVNEWAFPFHKADIEWKGIYEELKAFTGEEEFTVQFDGAKPDFETLKFAFEKTKAKLISNDNIVVIIYSENPYTTKVNVNGEIFDTSRIQNRSIEEWIKPITLRGMEWKGIFAELTDHIGTDEYNIQFMGDQEFMKPLMDACPAGVNVTYRMPLKQNRAAASSGSANVANGAAAAGGAAGVGQTVKGEFSEAAVLVKGKIREEVTDEEIERNLDNIPIKNKFVRQHLMAICAGITFIFCFLPFVSYKVVGEYEGSGGTGNVFDCLGGLKSAAASGLGGNLGKLAGAAAKQSGWNTAFAIALIIVPLIIIAMNYVPQLKKYRRIIAIVGPAVGIAFEIITIIALHAKYYSMSGAPSDLKLSTVIGAGFVLMIIMYVITAIVGLITYYGYKLPNKKVAV